MIPAQPGPAHICKNCQLPIRLVNRPLGPVYVHPTGSDVCGRPGEPVTHHAQPTAVRA